MEITWFGESCVRLRGKEGTVAADAFRSVVGPTGRGLTADVATYSHAEDESEAETRSRHAPPQTSSGPGSARTVAVPTSLDAAFALEVPGEFEVHDVLITGVRTFRDDARGAARGPNVAFVFQLDGVRAIHLGDIGHLLDEEMLGEVGRVDVVCVPVGGALPAARAAELVALLGANLVVPMPLHQSATDSQTALDRFLHEMGIQHPEPQPKLAVTATSVPAETTLVLLDSRSRPREPLAP